MYRFLKEIVTSLLLPALLLAPGSVVGGSLGTPSGKVILTVGGNIENTNVGGEAHFDRNMLEALGVTELAQETPWTEGRQTFSGVLGQKLLDAVGARGDTMLARAINDYEVAIPLADFRNYPVLFALKQNGSYMRVRNKGPIWIVYPREQFPELDNEETKQKWIWQLSSIIIK